MSLLWTLVLGVFIAPAGAQSARQAPEPGFGSQLPAGTTFGPANVAGSWARPTTPQGRVQATQLDQSSHFPQVTVNPTPGPHARRRQTYTYPLPPQAGPPAPGTRPVPLP